MKANSILSLIEDCAKLGFTSTHRLFRLPRPQKRVDGRDYSTSGFHGMGEE